MRSCDINEKEFAVDNNQQLHELDDEDHDINFQEENINDNLSDDAEQHGEENNEDNYFAGKEDD